MSYPSILFGGANLGSGNLATKEAALSLFGWLKDQGVTHYDSAARYPPDQPGKSEELLGLYQARSSKQVLIDTKILVTDISGKGSLAPSAIENSVDTSKSRIPHGINVLYCHRDDPETPLELSMEELNRQYTQRTFQKLGLSNFSPPQIENILRICEDHGWVKPTVFQGQYNALQRSMEKDLLPELRKNGFSYMAYSPLAGSFLTGALTNGKNLTGTRLEEGSRTGQMLRMLYDKPEMHSAVRKLQDGGLQHEIGLSEAALRWLFYHSALQAGDGIILGASSLEQAQQNLAYVKRGPLPHDLAALFDEVWRDLLV